MPHNKHRNRWLVVAAMFAASTPNGKSMLAPIDLPGAWLFPESLSILPDGTAYIGSMYGGVLRVSITSKKVETWIAPGAYGSGAMYGVLADARNGILWTCNNDYPGSPVSVPGADPGHWLKGFDLRTGEGRFSLKLPGDKPVCNDMAVGRDGSLYITDTGNPRILRWKPGATSLDIWAEDTVLGAGPDHRGLDGIAFGGDGNLYVNNVVSGSIYRVTMQSDGTAGSIISLKPSRALVHPDGMRPLGGMDFLLGEGEGVVRLSVKGDRAIVTTLARVAIQPTGVDSHGGMGWYVQAHLSAIFAPRSPAPVLPFHLTPVPLRRRP